MYIKKWSKMHGRVECCHNGNTGDKLLVSELTQTELGH